MTAEQVAQFFDYEISVAETQLISDTAKEVLALAPSQGFNCAAMSAAWGAMVMAHSSIPTQIVCGHLDWRSRRIFNYIKPIPTPEESMKELELWDGHCWVAFGGLIGDASLSRTVRYGKVPGSFKAHILTLLGPNAGPFCATAEQMQSADLTYIPCALLNDPQIDGLLAGFLPQR
ncbi:hypothetical protein [Mucilaginibacter sp. UYCu711]|uniref:hypothetical protein n=1 Tax=Mucilaginibacter sp. UYCu711 TaxID=3156339 RepID=UPI003D210FC0